MLMAVNCFEMEAAPITVVGVMGMFHSRSAIPYPCSYTIAPLRLTATLQPGERGLLYSANSWSTRVDDGPEDDCLQPPIAAITKIVKRRVCRGCGRTDDQLWNISLHVPIGSVLIVDR